MEKPLNEKGRCTSCDEYIINYYKNNREHEIARAQKSNRNKTRQEHNIYKKNLNRKNPISICLQHAKRRAKEKRIPFDITIDDLNIPTVCPVLGIELCVNEKFAKENSYSIDRIIPELGYVKGNVAIISYKANTIKNNASIEDLEKVLSWLKEKLNDEKR